MVVVFQELDTEEYSADDFGNDQENDQLVLAIPLSRVHCKRHAEAAAQENARIQAAQEHTQLLAGLGECVVIQPPIDDKCEKHRAEKENFRRKKYPHPSIG